MSELTQAKDRLEGLQALQDLTRDFTWLDDEWVLAFRISSGIGQMAYEAFYSTAACGSPLAKVCGQHYRNNKLLDNWPSSLIDTVRVSVRENGTEQAFITFNGRGKTFDSWFAKDNVVSSSWTDLQTQTANYFSIAGHLTTVRPVRRRFFVNHLYNDCPGDQGWLAVLDGQEVCQYAWPRVPANFNVPLILYSKRRNLVTFSSAADVGVADELLILVKFRDVLDCAGACVTTR